jgi:hypothetical protein
MDTGSGIDILFEDSLSPFVLGLGADSIGVFWVFPLVDATEFLSPIDNLGRPFCSADAGLLLPFSETPLMPPFTDNELPLREDLWSQLLALNRPFAMELKPPSGSRSPFICGRLLLPPSTYGSELSPTLPFIDVCEADLGFPLTFS